MKGVQVWQHPYVDVFKYVSLSDWRQSSKEGDVSEAIDKTLGKKVFKLQGSVSASNYIQIPRPKSELKSLALNGKYVYIVMQVPPGKLFSLHLDLQVFNTRTNSEEPLKVSLSNLFKENKLQSFLQVSCKIAAKWTVICVDLKNLLAEYFAERLVHKELRSVNLCANMTVRGVYTSDILYSPKTMPKEIALKSPKVEDWSKFYDWIFLPERFADENLERAEEDPPKARSSSASKPREPRKLEKPSKPRSKQFEKKTTVPKPPKEDLKPNHSDPIKTPSTPENPSKTLEKPPESPSKFLPQVPNSQERKKNSGKLVRAIKKSNSEPKLDTVQELNEKGLLPDPILVLENILSISPKANSLLWLPGEYFSSYPGDFRASCNKILVYASHSTIVAINPANSRKSFFFAHNSEVSILGLHQHFLVSADESCLILFWPIKSRKRPVPLSIKKFKEITFFAFFSNKMVVSGKDDLRRDSLIIFDTSKLVKKREIIHIAQQLSDFEVKVVKFFEDTKLISCGKEGIRIWQLKDDRFTSSSINPIEKDQSICTDLAISNKKAYVINTKSSVLIINLTTKECESCVFLNCSELFRIKILEDIVMVSSADAFVRFWPLDFKEVYMEVQHKSNVVAADMLGTSAATLTDSGVLVAIDLEGSSLTSLGKNYPGSLHVSTGSDKFCVVNNAIHVFQNDFSPFCEFAAAKDDPKIAAVSNCGKILACGFFSGAVRVFDLIRIQMVDEFLHLKSPVECLNFSPDGKVLLCIVEDGNFSVFDGNQAFQPVKDGKIEVPCAFSSGFSSDSMYFAMISNFSMSVSLFSTSPLGQKFKINTNNPFLHLAFSGKLLLTLLTDPSQMNYYSIVDNKLLNFKQVQLPCQLLKFSVSKNNSYIIGASPDFSLKVFDFFFSFPCQVFLGHSSEIKEIVWNDENLATLSEKDGALFWKFKGELSTIKSIENDCEDVEELSEESEAPVEVDVEREVEAYLRHVENITANMMVNSSPSLSFLFGFSPFFNGIFWAQEKGFLIYTVGAIVVKTLLVGEKKQMVMHAHYNSITVAALSPDQNMLATAEGNASFEGIAKIHVWNVETCKVTKVLEFHERTVTCLQFSPCSSYLCSIGSDPESILVIWELVLNRPIATSVLSSPGLQIKWLPQLASLEFVTLTRDSVVFWRLNSLKRLEFQPSESSLQDLTCLEFSPFFEDLASHLLLMGTSMGSVVVTNVRTNTLVLTKQVVSAKIQLICSRFQIVMVAGEFPEVLAWKWTDGIFGSVAFKVLFDGVPVGLSFNEDGTEGTVATDSGSIWYTEWINGSVRIISSHIKDITAVAGGEVLATGSSDNTIRIWNPLTSEQVSHIYTANTTCTCLAFHKNHPYLVAGFSDGSLKAFEVYTNKCLGSSRSLLTKITCLVFTSDCDSLILGSESGVMLAVIISKWSPFIIDFFEFCNMQTEILSVDCKSRQVLASTSTGLLNIWEKKFTGDFQEKLFEKSQEFNLIDFFDFKEPYERTKHVYPQAESLECKAKFDVISEKLVWIIIRGAQYLIQRNFSSHQVLRKINLAGFPLCLDLFEHRIAVGLADRRVMVYADGNIHEFLTHSAPVLQLALFKKGLATVSGNEIGYWSIY